LNGGVKFSYKLGFNQRSHAYKLKCDSNSKSIDYRWRNLQVYAHDQTL